MTTIDPDALKDIIREVLSERSTVDSQTHKDHHLFLDECITVDSQTHKDHHLFLDECIPVDSQTHKDHHLFLDECIPLLRDFLAYRAEKMERRKQKEAAIKKIKETAIGSIVVAAVGGFVYALQWVGHAVIVAIQSGGQP